MPQLPFVTLDVFTQERYRGNPLGVVQVPAGKAITDEQMQIVAREFNLSETIFVRQRQDGSDGISEWRVRIFLKDAEVPFAGESVSASTNSRHDVRWRQPHVLNDLLGMQVIPRLVRLCMLWARLPMERVEDDSC